MTNFMIPSNGGTLPSAIQAGTLPTEIDINTEVDDGRFPKLQWAASETKRIAAVVFKEENGKQVLRLRSQKEFSKFGSTPSIWFREPENRALAAQCALFYGDARPRIGSVWLEHETDINGNILANAGYALKSWIYSFYRHVTIQNLVRGGWDLYTHDLLVTCGRGADDAYLATLEEQIIASRQVIFKRIEDGHPVWEVEVIDVDIHVQFIDGLLLTAIEDLDATQGDFTEDEAMARMWEIFYGVEDRAAFYREMVQRGADDHACSPERRH
jgi:hypothetical protein